MDCPDCGAATVVVDAADYAALLPGDTPTVTLCERCLGLHPAPEATADPAGDLRGVSDAFPADNDAAVPLALLVGLLGNLALYRSEVDELVTAVERAGADPLLALDRLAADEALDPAVDLAGRRRQVEQLL